MFLATSLLAILANLWQVSSVELPSGQSGISVDLSESGLNYFAHEAQQILVDLFENSPLPSTEGIGYEISNLRIGQVEYPTINAMFEEGRGIIANSTVPALTVTGNYSVGGWAVGTYTGVFSATVRNLTIDTLLSLKIGRVGHLAPMVESCSSTMGDVEMDFEGELGSVIDMFSDLVKLGVSTAVDGRICSTAKWGAELYASSNSTEDENADSACNSGATETTKMTNFGGSVPFSMRTFSLNMSLTGEPEFQDDIGKIGFNGSILFNGQAAPPRDVFHDQPPMDKSLYGYPKSMLRIMLQDTVLNSFFSHVFRRKLFTLYDTVGMNDIPRILRGASSFFCRNCHVVIRGGLSHPPFVKVHRSDAVRLQLRGWVRAYMSAFGRKVDLFWVRTKINANLFPYLKNGRLYAETLLDGIYVDSNENNVGFMGKVFGFMMEESAQAVNNFIPMQLGPSIQKKLRIVFGEDSGGMPLPSVCGISFKSPMLYYIDRGMFIDADISYDSKKLVKIMRNVIATGVEEIRK